MSRIDNTCPTLHTCRIYLYLDLPILLTQWLNRMIHVHTLLFVHSCLRLSHLCTCLHSVSSPSLTAACAYQAASLCSVSPAWILEEKPVLSNRSCSCGLRQCFVSRMRETLLSGISRSCYCNSVFPLCCSNSQDKTALLMVVVLHFALFMAFVLPCAGLRASIPTPAIADFAVETGHYYHAYFQSKHW